MTKKPRPLEQFARAPLRPEDFVAVVEQVRQASDRDAAVHLGAFVEDRLNDAFLNLVNKENRARLEKEVLKAKFHEKINAALKLGLIDDRLFKNLEIIRLIRNAFAHSAKPITFETPEVIDAVGELIDDGKCVPKNMLNNASPTRMTFTSCCIAVTMTVQLRWIGKKLDLMGRVVEALSTARVSPTLKPFAEALTPFAKAIKQSAEELKKFET